MLNDQAQMVDALCKVMQVDCTIKSNALRYVQFASELREAGYTPEQILAWYSPGGWYYENDWRGKRGQRPHQTSIRETIGAAKLAGATRPNEIDNEYGGLNF